MTAPLLPPLIGLEGNRDKYAQRRGSGRVGWGKNRWWSRLRTILSTSFTQPLRRLRFLWRALSREEEKARVRTYGLISGNTRLNRLMSQRESFSGSSEPPSIKTSVTVLARSDVFHVMGILSFLGSIFRFWNTLRGRWPQFEYNVKVTLNSQDVEGK